ncbi:hypothetical protein LTR62_001171 [Meristemomyces frigidus]|uniref:DNA (cytosine-5-)-methyltransferase n=1 Tax=Meristemomyces frigidus TaxID=1508187 RepID=A0AAN7YI51_9PEZI|nr:hypothetical protein LTR62_001171 [Meristemomyces frigidus]
MFGNEALHHDSPRHAKRRKLSYVANSEPPYPRSAYEGGSPCAVTSEVEAITDLQVAHDTLYADSREPPQYTYFQLSHFSIYRSEAGKASHRGELISLDRLQRHGDGCPTFVFDGLLACGEEKRWVKGVHFDVLAIDGYSEEAASLFSSDYPTPLNISIQSKLANGEDVWYQLTTPSADYTRFYKPFVWLVRFTSAFICYLLTMKIVTLSHFKCGAQFPLWLHSRFAHNPTFIRWYDRCGNLTDYRTTVGANIGFLHKECYSIDQADRAAGLCNQPLWGEIDPVNLRAIPEQRSVYTKTVVTPFVHGCFRHMYFGQHLDEQGVTDTLLDQVNTRKVALGLTPWSDSGPEASLPTPQSLSSKGGGTPQSASKRGSTPDICVREGDVVAIEANNDGPWRSSDETWYAYVQQARRKRSSDEVLLDVLWLYRPGDTTIGAAYYPFPNELFLSDNCSCGTQAVPLMAVVDKVNVTWRATDPARVGNGLFVRQTFRTVHEEDQYDFRTIREADFNCSCSRSQAEHSEWADCLEKYEVGDTVLVITGKHDDADEQTNYSGADGKGSPNEEDFLKPAQVVAYHHTPRLSRVRLLSRTNEPDSKLNELTASEIYHDLSPAKIIRRCYIRVLRADQAIPVPYDRDGAGDCYFTRSTWSKGAEPSRIYNPPLRQGWNPYKPPPKLRGLGMFCGGGNFDRGLEDGGAVSFKYAIDWAPHALHSYRANSREVDTQYYLGSVNDYLAGAISSQTRAIPHSRTSKFALVGDVELISAGSPCPGFSDLQRDKYSEQSLTNASMVASVLSYVDFYSPEYLLLENVVSMTRSMGLDKKENVFSQLLATLVALGYQTQQFLMDAWSYGSSERRSRVFIVASVPNVAPLECPPYTHGHPLSSQFRATALGKAGNGKTFGSRRNLLTPFPCADISTNCADLPSIGDAQVQLCPAFPDHRAPTELGSSARRRISLIPVHPAGQSLIQAVQQHRITGGEPLDYYQKLGKLGSAAESTSFSRVVGTSLVPTITTALRVRCARMGRALHWDEHRVMTVMEFRRAQGFPDDEVLVGAPTQQLKIIGNSVNRAVSTALGIALRHAWTSTLARQDARQIGTDIQASSGNAKQDSASALTSSFKVAEHGKDINSNVTAEFDHDIKNNEAEDGLTAPAQQIARKDNVLEAPSPSASQSYPEQLQSRPDTIQLSQEQIDDIRRDGFKAILRMLEETKGLNWQRKGDGSKASDWLP